eukprot:COSAG02_NODE_407_length_22898_cov_135.264047_14_plen_206_part_00
MRRAIASYYCLPVFDPNSPRTHFASDVHVRVCRHALPVDNGAVFWMDPDEGPTARQVVLAQLTMATGTGSPMFFDAQGNSATSKHDWEEHCIEVMVGGPHSGAGSHSASGITMPEPGTGGSSKPLPGASAVTPTECPYVADGTCDEGTDKGSCPVGTDTADCLGEDCLTVDTAMINTYEASHRAPEPTQACFWLRSTDQVIWSDG